MAIVVRWRQVNLPIPHTPNCPSPSHGPSLQILPSPSAGPSAEGLLLLTVTGTQAGAGQGEFRPGLSL